LTKLSTLPNDIETSSSKDPFNAEESKQSATSQAVADELDFLSDQPKMPAPGAPTESFPGFSTPAPKTGTLGFYPLNSGLGRPQPAQSAAVSSIDPFATTSASNINP
jgi:hypothetical protein